MAQRDVGAAMWGGRRYDRPTPAPDPDAPAARVPGHVIREAASAFGTTASATLIGVGAGLQWGLGAGLLAVGLAIGTLAVLLGLGDS